MVTVILNDLLQSRGIKKRWLASQVGITEKNLGRFINGKNKVINLETLDKLCSILNCQISDIILYTPNEAICHSLDNHNDNLSVK